MTALRCIEAENRTMSKKPQLIALPIRGTLIQILLNFGNAKQVYIYKAPQRVHN